MRRNLVILNMLTVISMVLIGMTVRVDGEMTLSTGGRVNTFRDDLDQQTEGTEVTVPFGVLYTRDPFSIRLQTAYSNARFKPAESSASTIAAFTDTLLSVSYQMSKLLPVPLIWSLNVNLPTGRAQLDKQEKDALSGKDNLLDVYNFGEGLNVGLSLSTAKKFGNVTVGLNGGYTFKGKYDPTKDIPDDDLRPGNQLLATAKVNWKASPQIVLGTSVTYLHFGVDQVAGKKNYQLGDILVLGGNFNVAPSKPLAIGVGMQYLLPQKSQALVGNALKTEPENSKNVIFASTLDVTYAYSKTLAFQAVGGLRSYRASDQKDRTSGLPYAGKRVRYNFGPGVIYVLKQNISLQALATYVILYEDRDIDLNTNKTTTGVNVNLGVRYKF